MAGYLAEVLQEISFVKLKSEPNVYMTDLLVLGDKTTVDSIFKAIQKQVLHWLPQAWQTTTIPGRNIDHFGNCCIVGLQDSYIDNMPEDWNDHLQHGDRSRNRPLQTNNRG